MIRKLFKDLKENYFLQIKSYKIGNTIFINIQYLCQKGVETAILIINIIFFLFTNFDERKCLVNFHFFLYSKDQAMKKKTGKYF